MRFTHLKKNTKGNYRTQESRFSVGGRERESKRVSERETETETERNRHRDRERQGETTRHRDRIYSVKFSK